MTPQQATAGGRGGLAARLFAAQLLVALVGATTLWLVAAAVGPPTFRDHLRRAAGSVSPQTSRHVEDAFASASAVSIAVALAASLVAALAISGYVARRLAGPVTRLAAAAREVAAGRYAVQVAAPGLGAEFAALTGSFNTMAARLQAVETTRRRLLSDLAHEMRTPVATLQAYLDGLADGVLAVTPDTLAVLHDQAARLARLADDVGAVSSAEEGRLELRRRPLRAADLVTAAVAAAADRYAGKGIRLSSRVQPGLPPLLGDPERLGQVLSNLLDNALRHTPAGGTVTVTANGAPGAPGGVELTVADTGAGVAAEHLPRLFERFYRADTARDRAHGGSGIGLTIVKALVEAHGGTVRAASPGPGHGATFTVTLPAC